MTIYDFANPAVITAIISFLASVVVIIRNSMTAIKLNKEKVKTAQEIRDEMYKLFKDETSVNISPLLEKINELEKQNKLMAKIFALMQDKSPESRIAILELLSTQEVATTEIKQAKEAIEKEQKKEEEQVEALKEISKTNTNNYSDTTI